MKTKKPKCEHFDYRKIGEKLRKFFDVWKVFYVYHCPHCDTTAEVASGLFQYRRGKYEIRYKD